MLTILVEGFLLNIGLIAAIGAQNAYVIRQGIRGRHINLICLLCALSDLILIVAGVMGAGRFIAQSPLLSAVTGWGGAAFLLWFAWRSFRNAQNPQLLDEETIEKSAGSAAGGSAMTAALHAVAFTWLNPHMYLDLVVVIGGVSLKLAGDAERTAFIVGAALASFLWFFSIGWGANRAAPLFKKRMTWQILGGSICIIMVAIAASLIAHQLATAPA